MKLDVQLVPLDDSAILKWLIYSAGVSFSFALVEEKVIALGINVGGEVVVSRIMTEGLHTKLYWYEE